MDHEELQTVLGQISMRLLDNGLPAKASVEEQLLHLWQQLLHTETKLHSTTEELETLRTHQAKEMEEVESYVAHIRGLLEEREGLTAEYEKDNEHLRQELHQIRQQQESESKELEEMLAQEDLGEMGLSSPGEQVAYLLEPIGHTKTEELRQTGKEPQKTVENVSKAHSEISLEKNERQWLERDLEEASRRLAMAHQDIRRLTNELDAAKNNNLEPSDPIKLQRAKEQNEKLDAENRALRERVHTLESQNKKILVQLAINDSEQDAAKEQQKEKNISRNVQNENDSIHKRCLEAMEDGFVQVRELQRQLQRLRKDQEELEERNEELEALLGEAQNASKEGRHRHEAELEGLHRRERLALLEARLTEEQDWRKQLEADLSAAQAALRKDKEALQIGERELKKLRLEVKSLQTECQQGKTLIKSLTQVKAEKAALEEKLNEMQKSQNQLRSEQEQNVSGSKSTSDSCREGSRDRQQGDDRASERLSSLQTAHDALRSELLSERERTAALQAKLSSCVQEKLTAERQLEALELEEHSLSDHLKRYQEQNSVKEDLFSCQQPEQPHLLSNSPEGILNLYNNQELQRSQSLLTSAEAELHRVKEMNVDLKRRNLLLEQEKLKAQAKLLSHVSEGERQQQRIRELELQLADGSTKQSVLSSLQEELQTERANLAAANRKVLDLKQELKEKETKLGEEREKREKTSLEKSVLQAQAADAREYVKELQRSQSLLTSAEAELHHVKEMNVDLKRHNALLEQEKLKLSAELKQAIAKLHQAEGSVQGHLSEGERQQQRIRELELELADSSTKQSVLSSLQEELQTERAKLAAANRKALELQQQLTSVELQLREEEVLVQKINSLERDNGDLSDSLSALRERQHEDKTTRTLLEKRAEELQQQVTTLKVKEATLTHTNAEVNQLFQELNARLGDVESEHRKTKEEVKRLISTLTEEREKFLEERRELLQKISKLEEEGTRTTATVQHRFNMLEEEKRLLHHQIQMLSRQNCSLESALRKSASTLEQSEQGYLNLTMPSIPPKPRDK
ncbi:unnamed protein product [Tetraodon nigroviridis]|uniref:Chromosome 9 SCAF14490, whole genome shotgun sequence n=1 Tax=Tetraodon nigroviridis TaxID=99883 RepID=Q4SRU0_TETNG|nr:unnamed protein product [Tetraodon nigroviridis]